ncbi:hypothetical protein GS118_000299 [Salmonella enterica]|nr:hypothetical protein [Salmonella enterica]EEJ7901710.1 hypothetical protein [Salmonella enterica]
MRYRFGLKYDLIRPRVTLQSKAGIRGGEMGKWGNGEMGKWGNYVNSLR